jgi:FkbM family methyltransferase
MLNASVVRNGIIVIALLALLLLGELYRQTKIELTETKNNAREFREYVGCMIRQPHEERNCSESAFDYKNGFEFTTRYFGLLYSGNWHNSSDRFILRYGAWEYPALGLIHEIAQKLKITSNDTALDVGAFQGTHSLFLAKYFGAVYAFEPNPVSASVLRKNIEQNSLKNIFLHEVGLGAQSESRAYYDSDTGGSIIGSFTVPDERLIATKEFRIVKGDDFVEQERLKQIKFMKIDVEGFEGSVLSGLRKTLEEHRSVVQLEIKPSSKDSFETYDKLRTAFPARYTFLKFSPTVYGQNSSYNLTALSQDDFKGDIDIMAFPEEVAVKVPHSSGVSVRNLQSKAP